MLGKGHGTFLKEEQDGSVCKCLPSKPDNLTSFLGTQAKGLSDVALTGNPMVYGEMSKADMESSGGLWTCSALVGYTANKRDSDSEKVESEGPIPKSSGLNTGISHSSY